MFRGTWHLLISPVILQLCNPVNLQTCGCVNIQICKPRIKAPTKRIQAQTVMQQANTGGTVVAVQGQVETGFVRPDAKSHHKEWYAPEGYSETGYAQITLWRS